jgi:protocatechuate 3,4-dioxygenase beta subunit
LEGSVISATGGPVPRAQVRLQSPNTIQNGTQIQAATYSVTTDSSGMFVIENIEASGNLRLTAQKTGFLEGRYGQRTSTGAAIPFTLAPGQTLKGVAITMTPQGVVTGRVTDVNGDALQGVQVALLRRGFQRGVRTLIPTGTVQTNDQGEYRIANVTAGRYFLQATDRNTASILAAANSNSAPVETSNVPTYYPNGTEPISAAPMDVAAGQELQGIDIRMRQGRVYSVSGKVVSGTGEALSNPRVIALPRTGAIGSSLATELAIVSALGLQQVKTDGTFQLRNLTPGPYTAQVMMQVNGSTRPVGTLNFDITDKNIKDLIIATTSGATITGMIRLENGELKDVLPPPNPNAPQPAIPAGISPELAARVAAANSGRLNVNLQNASPNPLGGTVNAQVDANGTFKLENVGAGSYYVVSGTPAKTYIKAVHFNGTDVTRSPIDVSAGGGGTLEIVLAKNPPGVTGSVQNEKNEPVPQVMVSLWTQDPDNSSVQGGVRTLTTNASGAFNVGALRPGIYYAAAFEEIESSLAQAREFLLLLGGDATKVELKEGDAPTLQLKMIPEKKVKATEEKLP